MDRYMQLVVLLALVCACSAFEKIEVSFENGGTTLKLNKEDDVTMKCVVLTDETIKLTHDLKWYKEQERDDRIEIADKQEEKVPFDNDKKYRAKTISQTMKKGTNVTELIYTLDITGIDRNDAGKYRCASGQTEDLIETSDPVELIISPDEADPVLTTDALKETDGVYKFNLTNEVLCESAAPTSSMDLTLVMSIDQEPAGPEFEGPKVDVTWEGSTRGLKIPETKLDIRNPRWQPSKYGQFKVLCELMDGERLLGKAEITAVRDEPPMRAEIECYSNYGAKAARPEDTGLAIICTASKTDGVEDLFVEYNFINQDESVTLKEGEIKYGRSAKKDRDDPQKFVLEIPRVIKEIVTDGQNIYNVTLYGTKDGTIQTLDFTEFILPVLKTSRYASGSWTAMPLTPLLLLGILISLL